MALKGFLASGFQKLIGASRIKGANDQWLGEYNKLSYSTTTTPISAVSTVFGLNYLEWAPTGNVTISNSVALFATNPTTATIVTIKNTSSVYPITCSNSGSVAGSLSGNGAFTLKFNDTITFVYDVSAARWLEIGRSNPYQTFLYAIPSSGAIPATGARIQSINLSAASDVTMTQINSGFGALAGDLVYLYCQGTTNPITLQQDTAGSLGNGLIMNGDYVMTRYSAISFVYDGTRWIELSRNMVGGYV